MIPTFLLDASMPSVEQAISSLFQSVFGNLFLAGLFGLIFFVLIAVLGGADLAVALLVFIPLVIILSTFIGTWLAPVVLLGAGVFIAVAIMRILWR